MDVVLTNKNNNVMLLNKLLNNWDSKELQKKSKWAETSIDSNKSYSELD